MRVRDLSAAQVGVIRMVAGLRNGCPPKRPATWISLVRDGVLERTKAANGTPMYGFTAAGWVLVRELQTMDGDTVNDGAAGLMSCPFCVLALGFSDEDPDAAMSDLLGHIRSRHPDKDQTPAVLWPMIQVVPA